jgi:hypothetical protein
VELVNALGINENPPRLKQRCLIELLQDIGVSGAGILDLLSSILREGVEDY